MSWKEKIASLLFGSHGEENADEALPAEREYTPPEAEKPPAFEDPSQLELPQDHPIRQLYSLRQQESGNLPPIRLYMDEDGSLPQDMIAKEKNRLQSSLKNVCGSRLKAVKGRTRGKHSRKRSERTWTPRPGSFSPPTSSMPGCWFFRRWGPARS